MNGQLGGSTESVIVIDSDTEDDDQNKEPSGNTFICSGSDDSNRRCVEQKRQSPLTVKSGNGSAKDILREARQSSADLSQPLNQSMLHDAPQKTNGHDSDVIHKIHCHKRRVKSKRIVSSEESDDETVDSLCGAANEKSKKNSLSSKDPKEKQPQSLNKKANSTSGSKSVIPRSVVEKPNQHHKLFKESNNDRQSTVLCLLWQQVNDEPSCQSHKRPFTNFCNHENISKETVDKRNGALYPNRKRAE
ncbi:Translation initiation factor IF-2 [Dissostichus eleginoides]|uniref:Translation initiation factor IF-2 n=1 Tax=Dissostichus eleginoides TaxID=100907 RepID=A0AAD9CT97_DISEL|nr:Translation initiation factor IF-2 [Dissostichus eleginoides]